MAEALTAAVLSGVPHGFMTRRGGVSTGSLASLNCGFGADDDHAAVAENRRIAAASVLPDATLVGLHQIHSADVIVVEEPWADGDRPKGDAMVTNRPRVLLGIVTADCAPVLLADPLSGVIGAAHAGWRGAHGGVIANTVAAMERLGAHRERIVAAIGPCIAQPSYEVTEDFRAAFPAADERFFAAGRPGHLQFDLPGFVADRLRAAGLREVQVLGRDTYAEAGQFYSFRRATHRGEPTYGRLLSLIGRA